MRLLAVAFLLILPLLQPLQASAVDTLVVQSRQDAIFNEVLKGFSPSLRSSSIRVITLADFSEADIIQIIREERPKLILTLGDIALSSVKKIKTTPIISLMSLNLQTMQATHPNLTGISALIQPDKYMQIFAALKSKRVGVIYNPGKSASYIRRATAAALKHGIELVAKEVLSPKETQQKLSSLKGEVDAIWMIPDSVAVTQQNAEAYFLFSQGEKIPLIAFANVYLSLGAAAVLELDRNELGKQAAEMALKLTRGVSAEDVPIEPPRKFNLKTNPNVLKKLDIPSGIL